MDACACVCVVKWVRKEGGAVDDLWVRGVGVTCEVGKERAVGRVRCVWAWLLCWMVVVRQRLLTSMSIDLI